MTELLIDNVRNSLAYLGKDWKKLEILVETLNFVAKSNIARIRVKWCFEFCLISASFLEIEHLLK